MPSPAASLLSAACQLRVTPVSQAAQNLIVLAREEAGAEKIFQSDGVRLLLLMLDTGREDAMLAALRTLAGLCSGHRSRVGVGCSQGLGPVPHADVCPPRDQRIGLQGVLVGDSPWGL